MVAANGTFEIDNVRVYEAAAPDRQLAVNPDADTDLDGWSAGLTIRELSQEP